MVRILDETTADDAVELIGLRSRLLTARRMLASAEQVRCHADTCMVTIRFTTGRPRRGQIADAPGGPLAAAASEWLAARVRACDAELAKLGIAIAEDATPAAPRRT